MEFVDANGLKVATINYTLTVILPETYDKLQMRIGSAFNVIDKDEKYSEDYTVAWANNVNPDTKKVNYLWDTHSFNIDRIIEAYETRDAVLSAVEMLSSKRVDAPKRKHINFVY